MIIMSRMTAKTRVIGMRIFSIIERDGISADPFFLCLPRISPRYSFTAVNSYRPSSDKILVFFSRIRSVSQTKSPTAKIMRHIESNSSLLS